MTPAGKSLLLAILILTLVSGCVALPAPGTEGVDLLSGWSRGDLLLVQSPAGPDAQHSIIAFYAKQASGSLEFRLDLLDLQDPLSSDVYLAIDSAPGGSSQLPDGQTAGLLWDRLLVFPANAAPYALNADGSPVTGLTPRILRNPDLAAIILLAPAQALPGDVHHLRVQAFLTSPRSTTILDQTPVLTPGGAPPAPARLLLAFWDSLPAATPVQALRRWDGAHTGPYGQRHGLSVLVGAAEAHNIPLTLLDLKTPASLSALDLVGGTSSLAGLEARGLLSIPVTAFGDPLSDAESLALSRRAAQAFGFFTSQTAYGPIPESGLANLKAAYYRPVGRPDILEFNGVRLLPLPGSEPAGYPIATQNGPTDEFKKALLAATTPGAVIVTAGGSLPASELADSSVGPLFFEYIATHPWIEPLTQMDLLQMPARQISSWPLPGCADLLCSSQSVGSQSSPGRDTASAGLPVEQVQSQIRAGLDALPPSPLKDQAELAYLGLSTPMDNPAFTAVQSAYLGQVGYLLAAGRWAQAPAPISTCSQDLDWDGAPECVLASTDLFAVVRPDGGRLVFLGQRLGRDVQQWIGQKSQFAISWDDVGPGATSDPTEIPGALFGPGKYALFQASSSGGKLELKEPNSGISESFSITDHELDIQVKSPQAYATRLPLVLNAPGRFSLNWSANYPLPTIQGNAWSWQPAGGAGISIQVNRAALVSDTFLDSRAFMTLPEIPDRSNPPGHYLPIPLAVLTLTSSGNFELKISPTN